MKRPKALVLPNAIDTRKFVPDSRVREEVRAELGLENKYVLGMVGRLSAEKNYPFALELVAALRREDPGCMLVIAGGGEEQPAMEAKIAELGIGENVRLLGRRSDVDRLYQAFDVFLLTSFTEGFPVAAVEAMASGLPVLLSDVITRELAFCSAVEYIPLGKPKLWQAALLRCRQDRGREERYTEPAAQGLDIRTAAGQLEKIYREG
jgi:glycosyltransferase EpsF